MTLAQAFPKGLPSFDFPERHAENFRIMKIASRVPVGKQAFLVREEYDGIISRLDNAEKKRFSSTGVLRDGVQMDYQLGGQPGCGI